MSKVLSPESLQPTKGFCKITMLILVFVVLLGLHGAAAGELEMLRDMSQIIVAPIDALASNVNINFMQTFFDVFF